MPITQDQLVARFQKDEFDSNLDRVRNLVHIYRDRLGVSGASGRRPVHATDVLRAAVVFLHASLEEFLRSIAIFRIADANESVINNFPLSGLTSSGEPKKFLLGKLVTFRGQTIDEVIRESVRDYFQTAASFNNTNDISRVLVQSGVDPNGVSELFPDLTDFLERRHGIVHRADLNPKHGSGQHRAKSIGAGTVERWLATVTDFGDRVLELIAGDNVAGLSEH